MSGVATLGFILLMLLTCVAVLVFFARNRVDNRVWNTRVAPAVGVVGLGFTAYLTATNFGLLVGGWTVGAVFLVLTIASYLVGPLVGALKPSADPMAVSEFEAALDAGAEVPAQIRSTSATEDHA